MSGKVAIGFFGSLGERIGRSVVLDLPAAGGSVADLRAILAARYPEAAAELARPEVRAFVGDAMAGEEHRVAPGDRIEFLPPLSGG